MKARESPPHVARIVPCHSEEWHIGNVTFSIPESARIIIVVDDASTDRTRGISELPRGPRPVLVARDRNRGVGGAVISGYHEATACHVHFCVRMDGGGQIPLGRVPSLPDRGDMLHQPKGRA